METKELAILIIFFAPLAVTAILSVFIILYKKRINSHLKTIADNEQAFQSYKEATEHLKKYQKIEDTEEEVKRIFTEHEAKVFEIEQEALKIRSEADEYLTSAKEQSSIIQQSAQEEASNITLEAKKEAKATKEKSDQVLNQAYDVATRIKADANRKAKEIAEDAWDAKNNTEQYEATVKAMKNIIKGYGDEYLIPNESLLDDLAEEYNHKAAGEDLKQLRTQIKSMIKENKAAECDYAEMNRKKTAIEFVLDAFNGKVDTIMSKVKHDNYGKLKQQLEDAFRLVNHNGKPFRNARINESYFQVMLDQLNSAVTVQELKRQDIEEQRRIREEMREEEKARREFEKAQKQAEKEEKLLQKAMKEAEARLAGAAAEEKAKFEAQLLDLTAKLKEAEEKGQRAISMAQQTKQGHVYIISNIGSFGEDVFKIGLTRRLEPLDRVKELGDASVPFNFDVHAMIHSNDAPKLEKELHEKFSLNQMNKVNPRKEFFKVSLIDIKKQIEELDLETHWTMKAEAREYRETLQIENQMNLNTEKSSIAVTA